MGITKKKCCNTIIVFVALYIFFISGQLEIDSPIEKDKLQRAAIIDQAGIISPNESFGKNAKDILESEGYIVDYYPYETVTVDFFRNLPTYHYKIIILRVHSIPDDYITLFTSERYEITKYIPLQIDDQLEEVFYTRDDVQNKKAYFGINYNFVKRSMRGQFDNTVIIMMGCGGLKTTDMANAFIRKGASVYVGWNTELITINEMDVATIKLLHHFIKEKLTLKESIYLMFNDSDSSSKQLLSVP